MDIKLFGKQTIIYAIGNVSLRASAFLLIPLYTHVLTIKEFGILSTLLITMQLLIILMNLGMRNTFLRYSKEYEDKKIFGKLVGTCMFISLVGGLLLTVILMSFFQPAFCRLLHASDVFTYLLLTCISSIIQTVMMHIMTYYRIKDQANKFMIISLSSAIILIISNLILLLKFHQGVKGVLLSNIVSYLIITIFVFWDVIYKWTGIKISFNIIPKLCRFGLPLVVSMMGQLFITSASIYFVSYFQGPEVVAIYSLGYKFAMVLGILLNLPFQLSFQPFVFKNSENPELRSLISRILTYYFIAVGLISFSILILSRIFLPIIAPPEYAEAYLMIILILPIFVCDGLIVFGETLLSIELKTHLTGIVVGICGCLSLILNYLLVPIMGCYGAIIASFASSSCAGAILITLGIKNYYVPIKWMRIGFSIGLLIYLLLTVLLLCSKTDIIYFSGALFAVLFVLPFVKASNILDDVEKSMIRNWYKIARLSVNRLLIG